MSVKINGKQKVRKVVFNAGQNSADEPTTMQEGYATLIENALVTRVGRIEKRGGTERVGAEDDFEGTSPIQGITSITFPGVLNTVVRATNGGFQYLSSDFTEWTPISGCIPTGGAVDSDFLISGSVTAGALLSGGVCAVASGVATEFTQCMDLLFAFNGGEEVYIIDRELTAMVAGDTNDDVPRGLVAEWTNTNRLFVGGHKDREFRDFVWFSDTLEPTLFDRATNVIRFASGDADSGITSIKQFRQSEIIVYKNNSIFNVDISNADPSSWVSTVVSKEIGCPAGRTVANMGDEHIFLARDGVRLLSRTQYDVIKNGVISKPVQDIIDRINQDKIEESVGYFFDNRYFLFVPIDNAVLPNFGLVWDSQAARIAGSSDSGWTTISKNAWYPKCFTRFRFNDGEDSMLFGDNRDVTLVHKSLSGLSDDGGNIRVRIHGPMHFSDNVRGVIWGPLYIVADSEDDTRMYINGSINGGVFKTIGTVDIKQGGGIDLPVDLPFDFGIADDKTRAFLNPKKLGRGNTFMVEIIHDDSESEFTFNEYTLYAVEKGAR